MSAIIWSSRRMFTWRDSIGLNWMRKRTGSTFEPQQVGWEPMLCFQSTSIKGRSAGYPTPCNSEPAPAQNTPPTSSPPVKTKPVDGVQVNRSCCGGASVSSK